MEYRRDDDLRTRINTFLSGTFGLPDDDYYGRLDLTGLLSLKSALSDINNAVTMRITLGFVDWISTTLAMTVQETSVLRAQVISCKPNSNGFDVQWNGRHAFAAEVKCNMPVRGGLRYGRQQHDGILRDLVSLRTGKSKGQPLAQHTFRFMVFLDHPSIREANRHMLAKTQLRFLNHGETPDDSRVVYGVYIPLEETSRKPAAVSASVVPAPAVGCAPVLPALATALMDKPGTVNSFAPDRFTDTDRIWVATAMLLRPLPVGATVTARQIQAEIARLFGKTVAGPLIGQHLVSWMARAASAKTPSMGGNRKRYLFRTRDGVTPAADGDFRLYMLSDGCHDGFDKTGAYHPARGSLPGAYQELLDWYLGSYAGTV